MRLARRPAKASMPLGGTVSASFRIPLCADKINAATRSLSSLYAWASNLRRSSKALGVQVGLCGTALSLGRLSQPDYSLGGSGRGTVQPLPPRTRAHVPDIPGRPADLPDHYLRA